MLTYCEMDVLCLFIDVKHQKKWPGSTPTVTQYDNCNKTNNGIISIIVLDAKLSSFYSWTRCHCLVVPCKENKQYVVVIT